MDIKKFEAVMPVITAGLVDKIMAGSMLSEDEAMEKLYSSELYSALENEETKVWHYSVPKLYELYQSEAATGALELPEY